MAQEATADYRLGTGPIEKSGSRGVGGTMDDILKRLGNVEHAVTDIKSQVSGVAALLPLLATKADITALENSMLRWLVATVIAATSLTFVIAKYV